jgi:hypothetical protein
MEAASVGGLFILERDVRFSNRPVQCKTPCPFTPKSGHGVMRRLMVTSIILAVVFLSGRFAIPSAQAMTAPNPVGLAPAIQQANPVDEVQYVCRRVRRCGPTHAASATTKTPGQFARGFPGHK